MAIVGFGAGGGGGPGGVLPASLGTGDLLIGDGAGAWTANPNVPAASVGIVPFWDGVNRYRYTAAPADGNTWYFNAGTGLWVPRAPRFSGVLGFGAASIANVAVGWLYPWFDASGGVNTEATSGSLTAPVAGVISRMWVRHCQPGGATNVTYTLVVNTVATALTVTLSSAVALGSNLVTNITVAAGDQLGLSASNGSGALLAIRPTVVMQILEAA